MLGRVSSKQSGSSSCWRKLYESHDVLEVPREQFVVAALSFIRNRNADKFLPKTRLETENKPPRMRIGSKL